MVLGFIIKAIPTYIPRLVRGRENGTCVKCQLRGFSAFLTGADRLHNIESTFARTEQCNEGVMCTLLFFWWGTYHHQW